VKPLYGLVQAEGALPQEMLFEINAALDHIARHWTLGESEAEAVARALGHFKRSCLDVFKILVREAGEQYRELRKIDTSTIDNGEFDRQLHQLWHEIKVESTEARRLEGQPDDGSVPAFDKWQDVAEKCLRLRNDFLHHGSLEWAKRRETRESWMTRCRRWADGATLTAVVYAVAMPDRLTLGLGALVILLWVAAYAGTIYRFVRERFAAN